MLTPNRKDTGDHGDGHSGRESIQGLVDALSIGLGRPVLLDDATLEPIAFSRQWGPLDTVRSESILGRGASPQVRRALLDQGIAEAEGALRTDGDPALGMDERLCVPVRHAGRTLGYIWLLDPDHELDAVGVDRAEQTARRVAALLGQQAIEPLLDAAPTLTALASSHDGVRAEAIAHVREHGLLPDATYVCCLVAPTAPGVDLQLAGDRLQQRLSEGFALVGLLSDDELGLLISPEDPALGTLKPDELAHWAHAMVRSEVAVGQSGLIEDLDAVGEGLRQARIALRVAASTRVGASGFAAWAALGADRLLAQLSETARRDLPAGLRQVLGEEPELAATLAAFLDADGDANQTAASLSLHRSGLYYRLRRIEELTGLQLQHGDDRLLAHVAVRLAGYGRLRPS
ncbi:MAG TPA: helix-turn-helix domain-containing protein [Conexibacter sp.]|nr:helix-turn-helix domain-containing protein [Conexibacter sp.]